jgi:hypothetical protein
VERRETRSPSRAEAPGDQPPAPTGTFALPEAIARQRGVPKTPQGWWTLGLTVMAILIGAVLWLRYH